MSKNKMTETHRKRHEQLDKILNELVRDFMEETVQYPAKWTITGLLEWSREQASPFETIDTVAVSKPENS